MTRAEYVNHFIAKSNEAGFELSNVRNELEAHNVEPDEIKLIVRLVDNEIQRQALKGANNLKGKELMYAGAALAIFGIFMTIGTYTGVIDFGNVYVIAWGPVLAGVGMLFAGLARPR